MAINVFGGIYKNKKVLVTGHTGFKGSWLAHWLNGMGAEVHGISLAPPSEPNHIGLLNGVYNSVIQDITEREKIIEEIKKINPDIVFHLAAQPLVRLSYSQPYETYLSNIMGTVNVLDACRELPNLKAIVVVTSDKCYENKEWLWGYRENEPMGGNDPYSSSKGCVELVTAAYKHSFFNPDNYNNTHTVLIASARAGNVIGGGDWAMDRIVPDMVKATAINQPLYIRFPEATRPWQHVLEPLSGYLCLGWKLLEGKKEFAEGWNFGPENENNVKVLELVEKAKNFWPQITCTVDKNKHPHEANFLMLDSAKAKKMLEWKPVWNFNETVKHTVNWYKEYYESGTIATDNHIAIYTADAMTKQLPWAKA